MSFKVSKFISLFLAIVMIIGIFQSYDVFAVSKSSKSFAAVSVGETKAIEISAGETVYIEFVPAISGIYSLSSKSDIDVCGYLFDRNYNELAFNDDANPFVSGDFKIEYELNAGYIYLWAVRFCDDSASGLVLLTLESEYSYCEHLNKVKYDAVAPTCVDIGYESGEFCSDCGKWISGHSEVKALGHDFSDDWVIDKSATCTESGLMSHHCLRCGTRNEVTEIPPIGHTTITDFPISPTCTETGLTEGEHCSTCNETIIAQRLIPAVGHIPTTVEAVPATCTKNGYTAGTKCAVCQAVIKAPTVVKAKGHSYKTATIKATVSNNGSIVTKCTVCGVVESNVAVAKIASVSLSKTSLKYNGKAQKPSVTVKDSKGKTLKNGTDYTVKYSKGCKNVGQYTVTITFKGNYSGKKTLTFKIVPKGTSISKLTAGKKQFTVKWSKQTTQTSGYEIQYSTSSKMKNKKTVTVKKNSTTSKIIKNLKSKKKYYVRIRTFKTVKINGKNVKFYSSWSKIKSVKTK